MVSAESSANMLTCEMCAESISYGDDYVAHLQIVHNIVKNYNFFLQKANEQLKGGQKRKADVITLEEDDDEEMEEETLSKDQEQEDFVLESIFDSCMLNCKTSFFMHAQSKAKLIVSCMHKQAMTLWFLYFLQYSQAVSHILE